MSRKDTDIGEILEAAMGLGVDTPTFAKMLALLSAAHNLGINEATQKAIDEVEHSASAIRIQLRA